MNKENNPETVGGAYCGYCCKYEDEYGGESREDTAKRIGWYIREGMYCCPDCCKELEKVVKEGVK